MLGGEAEHSPSLSLAPALAWNLPSGSHPLSVVHTHTGVCWVRSLQGPCSLLLFLEWAIPELSLHTHLFLGFLLPSGTHVPLSANGVGVSYSNLCYTHVVGLQNLLVGLSHGDTREAH